MTLSLHRLREHLRIIATLGWMDFTLKYRWSVLGYLWSLAVPLVQFLVIYHVFFPFVHSSIPQYPLYLFLGIILWEFFSLTTSACMAMLHQKEHVIQKIRIPRLALALAVGWTHVIIFATRFVILLAFIAYVGADLSRGILYFPVVFAELLLLSLGIGMFLSAYSLKFRDVPHLWSVLLIMLFWLTPVAYPYHTTSSITADAARLVAHGVPLSFTGMLDTFIRFQPLSILLHDARRALLFGEMPTAAHTLGILAFCAVVFFLGALIFHRRSRYFIEEY
jgi:ABC-type polysaccharide/polyol phosphate export permease